MVGADVCFDNSHHASNGCAHPLFYAVSREIILRINRVLQESLIVLLRNTMLLESANFASLHDCAPDSRPGSGSSLHRRVEQRFHYSGGGIGLLWSRRGALNQGDRGYGWAAHARRDVASVPAAEAKGELR